MIFKRTYILTLLSLGCALCHADESYFGLTFVDTEYNDNLPANVVAIGDGGRVAKCIALTDGEPFFSPYNFRAKSLTYTRTFSDEYWQPLYVPYNLSYEAWCNYAEVCKLSDVYQYDDNNDGRFDRTVLEFVKVTEGNINPNAPYIIRAYSPGTVTFESSDCIVRATPNEGGRVGCMASNFIFMLIGTYQDIAISGYLGDYDLRANAFRISEGSIMAPYDVFLEITPNYNGYNPSDRDELPDEVLLKIGDEILGIPAMLIDDDQSTSVFDLQGRKIQNPSHGIYITSKGEKLKVRNF